MLDEFLGVAFEVSLERLAFGGGARVCPRTGQRLGDDLAVLQCHDELGTEPRGLEPGVIDREAALGGVAPPASDERSNHVDLLAEIDGAGQNDLLVLAGFDLGDAPSYAINVLVSGRVEINLQLPLCLRRTRPPRNELHRVFDSLRIVSRDGDAVGRNGDFHAGNHETEERPFSRRKGQPACECGVVEARLAEYSASIRRIFGNKVPCHGGNALCHGLGNGFICQCRHRGPCGVDK